MFNYKNIKALFSLVFVLFSGIAFGQNYSQVIEEVIKVKGIMQESQLTTLGITEKQVTKTYLDGFGRPIQTIGIGASPNQKNIIQPIVYNSLGQQTQQYLPFAGNDASGTFHSNAIAEQSAFYATSGQKVATDNAPYSQQVFENSPMQRLLQSGTVGTGFQPGEHYKSMAYRLNLPSETVRRWNADGTAGSTYAAGSLSVTLATDEEGGQTAVYLDKAGRTVLKKQLLNQGGVSWVETYYVYGDAGYLLYVVPPKAVRVMDNSGNYNLLQPALSGLLFIYGYDELGRQTERTIPGGTVAYMVYDPLDRLVLAQDGNLRTGNKWNYIKYDSKGIAVSQGIYTDGSHTSRQSMQAYVSGLDYSINYFESRNSNAGTGYYSNVVFPSVNIEPLAYSYYSDYDIDGNGVDDYTYQAQGLTGEAAQASFVRGMPTVTTKRTVGSGLSNVWLTTVVFYDRYGNTIQTRSNNQLNASINNSRTVVPDFNGQVIRNKTVQIAGSTTTVINGEYSYDHVGRLKSVDESYNGGTPVRIAAYEYNEIGQLVDRKLHSTNGGAGYLQSIDYRYTIRGQLSSINNSTLSVDGLNDDANDVFGMEILYNQVDGGLGNTAKYNGMVSAVKWKANAPGVSTGNERSYTFSYDHLMRLTSANYADRNGGSWGNIGGFDEKNISYDVNGNILTLQRNAILSGSVTAVDDLTYSYDGNRLLNVTDGSGGSYGLFGFKNLTGSSAAYGYTDNGNMTIDAKKGLSIAYNELNRTSRIAITTASNRYIDYTYDAAGTMIRKQAFDQGSLVKTTDYIDGFVYENNVLAYFGMSEGRVRNASGTLKLEYMIKDQQGNVRVSFEEQGGVAVVRQENSYYPFGLSMPGNTLPTAANKNLYNGGSEWQDDFADLPDLQQTFYRMYDAALGRFVAADPMAEASESMTSYQYALNNSIIFNDPLGDKAAGYIPNSRRIGPGSGNHWSDGMMFSDWDGWGGGSDTYRALMGQGFMDWGGDLVRFENGIRQTIQNNGSAGLGYWTDSNPTMTDFGNGGSHLGTVERGMKFVKVGNGITESGSFGGAIDGFNTGLGIFGLGQGQLQFIYEAMVVAESSATFSNISKISKLRVLGQSAGVLNSLQAVGKVANYAGLGVVVGKVLYNQEVKLSDVLDSVIGAAAFIPGWGWGVAGVYFISDMATKSISGKSIGEHLNEHYGNKAIVSWK